jgi:hypothetical protein
MASIEQARQVQRDFKLLDRHVAYVDPGTGEFWLAHTAAERAIQLSVSLSQCKIHRWLEDSSLYGFNADCTLCFPAAGWYSIAYEHEVWPLVF